MTFLVTAFVVFVGSFIAVPIFMLFVRLFGLYTVVWECHAKVFVLFGKVLGVIDEPGLHFPVLEFGPKALLVSWFGKVHTLDRRLDQLYLRSQAVNTEEGTPMGIGVWYEMRVQDPVDYLFKNSDPGGSLKANVANATVRCLSNMPLSEMLADRHPMSRAVRSEVSPRAESWGYELGSVYIRKVHFRDRVMISQIEEKVVNRLRQVTSAIRQAGANRVDVIRSRAEKEAAVEFAKAQATRPRLVGQAFAQISQEPGIVQTLLELLRLEKLKETGASLTLIPDGGSSVLSDLLATEVDVRPSLPRSD